MFFNWNVRPRLQTNNYIILAHECTHTHSRVQCESHACDTRVFVKLPLSCTVYSAHTKYPYACTCTSYIIQVQKTIKNIERKVGMEYQKAHKRTRVVRMVTKVKGCPYFYLSSVFSCLFARHFKLFLVSF